MNRDVEFLIDIVQSSEIILDYITECPKDDFFKNLILQDAVIRRLLVIGEAARRISEATRQSLPNISWQEIKGMRNRLVHEYDDINLNIVWNVLHEEIPKLIRELKPIIPPEN